VSAVGTAKSHRACPGRASASGVAPPADRAKHSPLSPLSPKGDLDPTEPGKVGKEGNVSAATGDGDDVSGLVRHESPAIEARLRARRQPSPGIALARAESRLLNKEPCLKRNSFRPGPSKTFPTFPTFPAIGTRIRLDRGKWGMWGMFQRCSAQTGIIFGQRPVGLGARMP
jgi:hypothetical protein